MPLASENTFLLGMWNFKVRQWINTIEADFFFLLSQEFEIILSPFFVNNFYQLSHELNLFWLLLFFLSSSLPAGLIRSLLKIFHKIIFPLLLGLVWFFLPSFQQCQDLFLLSNLSYIHVFYSSIVFLSCFVCFALILQFHISWLGTVTAWVHFKWMVHMI